MAKFLWVERELQRKKQQRHYMHKIGSEVDLGKKGGVGEMF